MQCDHQHFCHFLARKHYNFFSDSNIANVWYKWRKCKSKRIVDPYSTNPMHYATIPWKLRDWSRICTTSSWSIGYPCGYPIDLEGARVDQTRKIFWLIAMFQTAQTWLLSPVLQYRAPVHYTPVKQSHPAMSEWSTGGESEFCLLRWITGVEYFVKTTFVFCC